MTITIEEMEQLADRAGEMREQMRAERVASSDAVGAFQQRHGDIDHGDPLCREFDRIKDHRDAMLNLGHSLTQLRLIAETVRSDLRRVELTKEPTK
jgi:hypothetical protein